MVTSENIYCVRNFGITILKINLSYYMIDPRWRMQHLHLQKLLTLSTLMMLLHIFLLTSALRTRTEDVKQVIDPSAIKERNHGGWLRLGKIIYYQRTFRGKRKIAKYRASRKREGIYISIPLEQILAREWGKKQERERQNNCVSITENVFLSLHRSQRSGGTMK